MNEALPNTTVSTNATLFREEAGRARRYAAAMTDKKVINRLNEIAAYDELAAGQDPGQPIATNRVPARRLPHCPNGDRPDARLWSNQQSTAS